MSKLLKKLAFKMFNGLNKCNELLYNIVNNNDSDNNLDIDDNNYT